MTQIPDRCLLIHRMEEVLVEKKKIDLQQRRRKNLKLCAASFRITEHEDNKGIVIDTTNSRCRGRCFAGNYKTAYTFGLLEYVASCLSDGF